MKTKEAKNPYRNLSTEPVKAPRGEVKNPTATVKSTGEDMRARRGK